MHPRSSQGVTERVEVKGMGSGDGHRAGASPAPTIHEAVARILAEDLLAQNTLRSNYLLFLGYENPVIRKGYIQKVG